PGRTRRRRRPFRPAISSPFAATGKNSGRAARIQAAFSTSCACRKGSENKTFRSLRPLSLPRPASFHFEGRNESGGYRQCLVSVEWGEVSRQSRDGEGVL